MMNSQTSEFRLLLDRLQAGDPEAADRLVDLYSPQIARAIRRTFRRRRLKQTYDTDDCMQSVWGSIFRDLGRLARLQSPKHLVGYLRRTARNKLSDRHRWLDSYEGVRKSVVSLDEMELEDEFHIPDGEPTPSYQVELREEADLCREVLDAEERAVIDLFAAGMSVAAIERKLAPFNSGRTARTVLRDALKKMRFRL